MAHPKSLEAFNATIAVKVKELHDRLAEAGHPVTPEEAKALYCVGWAAIADLVGHDAGREMFLATAKELAREADGLRALREAELSDETSGGSS